MYMFLYVIVNFFFDCLTPGWFGWLTTLAVIELVCLLYVWNIDTTVVSIVQNFCSDQVWRHSNFFLLWLFRTAKCLTSTLHQGLRLAIWRERTHHCTVSAGNQTSTASWCMFTTPGLLFKLLSYCEWMQRCSNFPHLLLSLTVAVITVMSGSMAIALTSQRSRRRQFKNGTAWDVEVIKKIFFYHSI